MNTPVQLPWFQRGESFDVSSQSLPWHITDVKLQDYWPRGADGSDILVGVADTGIDEEHPHIEGRIRHAHAYARARGRRVPEHYDDNGHGTHVATTIARMAPKASFSIAKVLGANGSGWNHHVAAGIRRLADDGCNIICLSLGGPTDDTDTREAVEYAKSKGCILFVASGNEGRASVGYPSQHAVAVGAIDRGNELAYFSNQGIHLDTVGYGVGIRAGVPGGGEQLMDGTSMATPWVAAIAACRQSLEKKELGSIYTNSDERLMRLSTFTKDLGPEGRDTGYGFGKPDLSKLLTIQAVAPDPVPAPEPEGNPEPMIVWLQGQRSGRKYEPVVFHPLDTE